MSVTGLLIVDKPCGMTSHDVVNKVRKKLGTKKVGHAGTLDPEASGVLVLCVGFATKLLEYVTADDKTYVGEVTFGVGTDTDDRAGEVLAESSAVSVRLEDVENSAKALEQMVLQRPPSFAAIHVNGKRAYELARSGEVVDLPLRPVVIHRLKVLSFQPGHRAVARFEVSCSKGTYVRALCRDWGDMVQVPAHLSMLRRIKSGRYTIGEAIPLDQLVSSSNPQAYIQRPIEAVRDFGRIRLSREQSEKLCMGQRVLAQEQATLEPMSGLPNESLCAAVGDEDQLIAMVRVECRDDGSWLHPVKVFQQVHPIR